MKVKSLWNSFELRPSLRFLLATTLLLLPLKAIAASMVEYALLLVAVLLLAASTYQQVPPGWSVVIGHLQADVVAARDANQEGDQVNELINLSKAIGATRALLGMTVACDGCGTARTTLQEILGRLSRLKTEAVGASESCHPNGLVQPNEQCDPTASPTGCPVTTELTFCDDTCRCVPVPIP